MSTRALAFNEDFAWLNGFGGGLAAACHGLDNPFSGEEPGSQEFYETTLGFQSSHGLKVDGWFGGDTLKVYTEAFAKPALQLEGMDISGYQKPERLDVPALKAAGLGGFGMVKYIESKYNDLAISAGEHTLAFCENDIPTGGYSFIRTDKWHTSKFLTHAREQAERFIRAIEQVEAFLKAYGVHVYVKLLPTVDMEHKGYKVNKSTGKVRYGKEMLAMYTDNRTEYVRRLTEGHAVVVEVIKRELGILPLLYSYPNYLRKRVKPIPELTQCPLWNSIRYKGSPHKYKQHKVPAEYEGQLVLKQWQTDGSDPRVLEIYGRRLDINQAPYGLAPLVWS